MPIDIIKIGQIKKLKQLRKYDLDKPIYNSNYCFHYLILTNNLTALKLYKFPINMVNDEDYNGFMLAAKEEKITILKYFIDNYPYIYNKNNTNLVFLHLLPPKSKEYSNIISYLAKIDGIDWKLLFQTYSSNNHTCCLDLLFTSSYSIIMKTIKILNLDYSNYIAHPAYFNCINKLLKPQYIIDILDYLYTNDTNIFNYVDDMGYNISYLIVLLDNFELIKYIIKKCGTLLDKYSPLSTKHIFNISYIIALTTNNFTHCRYILKHVMKKHDFDETNMDGNNIVHFILHSRINTKKGDNIIEDTILSHYGKKYTWSHTNLEKETTLDLITLLDYSIYHKYVKKISIDKHIDKNIDKHWYKYIKTLPKISHNTDIIMIKSNYAHSNMFQAKFTDSAIFAFYLIEKYKKLYLPIYHGIYKANWDVNFKSPDELLSQYNNFPWLIIWNNKDSYWIHPNLSLLILNAYKQKYTHAFILLSVRTKFDGLHATIILYDFNKNLVERFDPYGNTSILDTDIDIFLEKELTTGTPFKYITPSVYFPVAGFQTLSNENNIINQKLGDFGGYCLAWCFWYIEHRIINKIDPKDLIRKTLNKFMNLKIKPMEYIRNYSNKISIYRLQFYKKYKLGEDIASNENLTEEEHVEIFNSIIKTMLQIKGKKCLSV